MLFDALSALASKLREHIGRPDAHQFYPGGLRSNYVSCEHVAAIADRLEEAIHAAATVERARKTALVRDRDEWRAGAETWQAAYEFTSQRCRALEREMAYDVEHELLTLSALLTTIVDRDNARAEAAGLAQALRDQEEVLERETTLCERLSDRLVNLNAALSGLLCELGEDTEDMGEDELVPTLRDLIALMGSPRPAPAAPSPASRFARLFRRFSA